QVGKTTLFQQIVRKYSLGGKENGPSVKPSVNYVESRIALENNIYKLIDTPSFRLRPQTQIEKEGKKQIQELLKKSDLILWLVEEVDNEILLLSKYLKKIATPKILVVNKADVEGGGEESFFSFRVLRLEFWVAISALKTTNLDQLIKQIIMKKSTNTNNDVYK
ncbi:4053_t:CDS:1, partial [Racocetra persica]